MFKFSIRELFLLTLVVGLALGWVLERRKLITNNRYLSDMNILYKERVDLYRKLDDASALGNHSFELPDLPGLEAR